VSTHPQRQAVIAAVVKALRVARERQGLSMSAVATRAGLSQQMVSYVERQMRMPTIDTLLRMAEATNVDLSALLAKAQKSRPAKRP
jgi:transcriptional regulator with XRE-family HTH domain